MYTIPIGSYRMTLKLKNIQPLVVFSYIKYTNTNFFFFSSSPFKILIMYTFLYILSKTAKTGRLKLNGCYIVFPFILCVPFMLPMSVS